MSFNIGDNFYLNLAEMFEVVPKNTATGSTAHLSYGFIAWSGLGDSPETSSTNYYDWIDEASGERLIGADDGTVLLEIIDIDETNEIVESKRPDSAWSPSVFLTFAEMEEFAAF